MTTPRNEAVARLRDGLLAIEETSTDSKSRALAATLAASFDAALEAARAEGRQALAELADACEGLTPFVRLGEGPLGDDPAANAMRRAFDALGAARAILHDTEAPEGGE